MGGGVPMIVLGGAVFQVRRGGLKTSAWGEWRGDKASEFFLTAFAFGGGGGGMGYTKIHKYIKYIKIHKFLPAGTVFRRGRGGGIPSPMDMYALRRRPSPAVWQTYMHMYV